MNPYAIPSLIGFVFTFILAIYVLLNNPGGKANRAFTLLIFSCDIWLFGEFMVGISHSHETAWFWSKFFMSGVMFIPPTYLYFTQIFPVETRLLSRIRSPIIIFIPSFIFLYLVIFTPHIISYSTLDFFGYDQETGGLYPLFVGYFFLYIFTGLFTLFRRNHLSTNTMEKDQIIHVLLGTFIPTSIGGMVDLALPLLGFNPPTVASSFSVLMVAILARGIVKYNLLIFDPVYECDLVQKDREYRIYDLAPGRLYLMKKEDASKGMEVFMDMVAHCSQGMCITKRFPDDVRKTYGILKTPVIDLSREMWDLDQLNLGIKGFVQKAEDGIVLVDDLDYVILHNSLNTVKEFTGQLYSDIKGTNSKVIAAYDPASMDLKTVKELEDYVASLWMEEALGTLANPRRREALFILESQKMAFSEIAREMRLSRMPPKLSFHLSGLKSAGMVEQDHERSYSLTKRGEEGLGIIKGVMETLRAEIES